MKRIQTRVLIDGRPMLIHGANRIATLRVQARALQPGDCVGSGETVVSVSAGVRTPRGKVDVTLQRNGKARAAAWGARTEISVTRAVLDEAAH